MTYVHRLPGGLTVLGVNRNETDYLYQEIFQQRAYIPPYELRLASRPVVLDIGANIGLFTLFARDQWPDARIVAFEPVPEVFAVLRRNVEHLFPDVTLHNVAVGDTEGERPLTYYPHHTMMSGYDADPVTARALASVYIANVAADLDEDVRAEFLVEVAELVDQSLDERRLIPCAMVSLGTFAAGSALDRVDLMKIDVEGFELRVLEGVGDALWPGVRNVAVEVADCRGRLAAVIRFLERQDMRTLVRQARGYQGTELHMVFAWREN